MCAVCRRPLPVPDGERKRGRPRQTCGQRCKTRRDRVLRILKRRERWQARAVAGGHQRLAAAIAAGTQALRRGALVAPTITQETLQRVYHEQQAQLRARVRR